MIGQSTIASKQRRGIYNNGKRVAGYPASPKLRVSGNLTYKLPSSVSGSTSEKVYDTIQINVSTSSIRWYERGNFNHITNMPTTVYLKIAFANSISTTTLTLVDDGNGYYHVSSSRSIRLNSGDKLGTSPYCAYITDSSNNLYYGSASIISSYISSSGSGTGYITTIKYNSDITAFTYDNEYNLTLPLSIAESTSTFETYLKNNVNFIKPVPLIRTNSSAAVSNILTYSIL